MRLQVAGFGAYEDGLRRLRTALDRGDLEAARAVAAAGWGLEGGEEKPLPILSAFLADPPPGYAEAARAAAGSVEWLGRLEHDEVAALLPHAEALVMPSTFPEAFGMVAVEAASAGTLPVSAGHSGMREVSERLSADQPRRGRATDVVPDRARRGPGDRRPTRPLARAARGDPRRGPGDARRHRRAPLELGGSGPWSARCGGRKPRWVADPGPLVPTAT